MQPNCPYCAADAELVTGAEIYPNRSDLNELRFWRCAPCNAYVGCHKAGSGYGDGTLPLGRLANAVLRRAKMQAHAAFDPLWKTRRMSRRKAYSWLAGELGMPVKAVHIGEFDEALCMRVVQACKMANVRIQRAAKSAAF
jgi:zinc-finger-containing domain